MRKFTISDIHGCPKTFKALLDRISFSKGDELYLLGDYIDRGPDSRGVIDHIWHLQETGHTVHCLRGNHEQMLLSLQSSSIVKQPYPTTEGEPETKQVQQITEAHIEWMKNLKYYIEVDHYILVHAGLNFQIESPFEDKKEMIWIRYWYDDIDRDWLGDRIIVHGHTPTHQLDIKNSIKELAKIPALNIDNGCCFERSGLGHLCALELGKNEVTFQANIDWM